jgi:hypothetical protein
MTCGTKGESARCLVSVGAARTAKASSEGWRVRLRPNNRTVAQTHSPPLAATIAHSRQSWACALSNQLDR